MGKMRITREMLDRSPGGIHAKFIDLGGRGMKIYRAKMARDAQFNNQTILHDMGVAPDCWYPFEFDGPYGEKLYAFFTETVEVYSDSKEYDLSLSSESEADAYYNRFTDAMKDLHSLLVAKGINWDDDHHDNVGIDADGNPVLIDCDYCYGDELVVVGCGACNEWE